MGQLEKVRKEADEIKDAIKAESVKSINAHRMFPRQRKRKSASLVILFCFRFLSGHTSKRANRVRASVT